jgi:uncharacterized protein (TIGR02117 family)
MRILLRWAAVLAGLLASLAGLYLAAALVLARVPVNGEFRPAAGGVQVGVVSNGVHADLLLPVNAGGVDWRERFPLAAFPGLSPAADAPAYVSIGWGHRQFYLETPHWTDVRPLTALRALLGVGGSLLHVSYWPPVAAGENVAWTWVPIAAYRELATYVEASLAPDDAGRARPIVGEAYRENDAFFEGKGAYGPLLTCNEWTGRALARAGIRTGVWTPFPAAVLDHLRALPAP